MKLPDIAYGLKAKVAEADVLTEIPWSENPDVAQQRRRRCRRRRRRASPGGACWPRPGPVIGVVVVTSVGQTVTPLEPIGLLAVRQSRRGHSGSRSTARPTQAQGHERRDLAGLDAEVAGPTAVHADAGRPRAMAVHEARLPINCVEGWSVGANWRGLSPARDGRAGRRHRRVPGAGACRSRQDGSSTTRIVEGPSSAALLATHLNGQRLDLDHGYPLRLIAPNRPGVLNTKWLSRIEVLS